jgi:hydrogenase maturation protease
MKWFAEGGLGLMSRVLIIGFGNPLRSDDGVGWHAAEELEHKLSGRGVEVITCHQLTPELADIVSTSPVVVFVDAQCGVPGTVTCSRVRPQAPTDAFSHRLSPGAVLGLAQKLYGQTPLAFAFAICGECFEVGEVLSPLVRANLPDLVARVAAIACAPGIDSPTSQYNLDERAGLVSRTLLQRRQQWGHTVDSYLGW